jgi:hypothetical protein
MGGNGFMKVVVDTSKRLAVIASRAKGTRDAYVESDISVFGALWQVDQKGRDNMRNTIETAERTGVPAEQTVEWILSDNSLRATTVAELHAVLTAYTVRLGKTFEKYGVWRAAGAKTEFVI